MIQTTPFIHSVGHVLDNAMYYKTWYSNYKEGFFMKKGSLKRKSSKMFLTLVLALVLCLGSAISSFAISGEWKQDSTGWWFKKTDGSYPKSSWEEINSKWYYFDETGYIATSEYREGYWVGSDGAWVSTYKGGKWKSDKKGKWYTDNSGWYPVSSWLKVDGKWYYFDKTGYLVTKQWVDNCYVGEDGAWIPNAKKVDYSGTYVDTFAGRAVVTIKKQGSLEDYYTINVRWPNSAYQAYEWNMSGEFDMEGTFKYKEGTKTKIDYDAAGSSTSTVVYTKLSGTIKIVDDILTWTDDKENVAKGNEFKKQEVEITGKDYTGTYTETKSHRGIFDIKATANDFYSVTVTWSSSAAERAVWTFTGTFDKDGVMKYTDCTKANVTFDEKGNSISTTVYKKGSGSIKISEKDVLTWQNENEDVAVDCEFAKDAK